MNSTALYTGIAVILAIIVVALFFFFPNYLHGVSGTGQNDQATSATATAGTAGAASQAATPAPTELGVQDVKAGTGAEARPGSEVVVQYVGKLQDGTIFDQSSAHPDIMPGCDKAGEFCFILGEGQVIPGWDQGLVGMKVGGERTLVIPPALAYGSQGAGPIPPNATLTFDVKLLDVKQVSSSTPYAPTGPAAD